MPRKITQIIQHPSPSTSTLPVQPPPLDYNLAENQNLKRMIDHFANSEFAVKATEGSEEVRGLDDWEKMFCSQEMMERYLSATKGNLPKAISRLEDTLVWRRTMDIYNVKAMAEELAPEFESGKIVILGYNKTSKPILYTWPSRNVLPPSQRQVKHMMFSMERVIDLQVAGVQEVMFAADMSGKTQTQSGAMSVSRQILSNLQAHYPARLGGAALVKLPWLGSLFVTLLWPWIDPDTKKKIHVNADLSTLVDKEQLLDLYGGEIEFDYTPQYLTELVDYCVERRNANLRRWKDNGGKVGMSEWDIFERVGEGVTNGH